MSSPLESGSMDDLDKQEIRLAMLYHGGPVMGHVVMTSLSGGTVISSPITYDHQQVGAVLQSDDNYGFAQTEDALYSDLSAEQQALRERMQQWKDDPEIDFA